MLSSPGSQAGPEEAINANMRYVVSTICIADKTHGLGGRLGETLGMLENSFKS